MAAKNYYGNMPDTRRIILVDRQDFIVKFQHRDAATGEVTDWGGDTIKFVFDDGTEWVPTYSGAVATIHVDKAVTATVQNGLGYSRVFTTSAGADFVLDMGTVIRK